MARPEAFIKIPKERIGVLIGSEGKTKKTIEEKLSVELRIDSEAGNVQAIVKEDCADPSVLFKAKDVITALGRGFSPEHAFRLIHNEETMLEIIDLRIIFGKSDSDIKRVKGRIIGMKGKTRKVIEELTDADLAIYGHTIAIIGTFAQVNIAKEAIEMLIKGSMHRNVYRFLNKKRRELKKKMLDLWEKPPDHPRHIRSRPHRP